MATSPGIPTTPGTTGTVGAHLTPSAPHTHGTGTLGVLPTPVPQDAHLHGTALPPAVGHFERVAIVSPEGGEPGLWTMGSTCCRKIDRLNKRKDAHQNMKRAFLLLKGYLTEADPDLARLTIDIDYCLVTKLSKYGDREEMSFDEVRAAIENNRHLLENFGNVDNFFRWCFSQFQTASHKSGIENIEHYEPHGPDRLGSLHGPEAVNVDRRSDHKFTAKKQAHCLLEDQQKTKHNMGTFVAHCFKGQNHSNTKECDAMKKIIQAEAFVIRLRKDLKSHIERLERNRQANQNAIRNARALLNALGSLNRHALWVAAISQDPQDCMDKLLHDYYEDTYSGKKEADKPTFEQFCRSDEGLTFQRHAAQVAATMIHDPKEYRLFCIEHGLIPCQYGMNAFLMHVLQATQPLDIDFSHWGLNLQDGEPAALAALFLRARDQTLLFDRHILDEQRVIPSTMLPPTGAQMLRNALKDTDKQRGFWPYLCDTTYNPGLGDKVTSWMTPWRDSVALSPLAAGG